MVSALMHRRRLKALGWLFVATAIAVAGFHSAMAQAQAPHSVAASEKAARQIVVDASGLLEVVPNLATIRLGVIGDAQDQDAALLANAKIAAGLIAKARQSGVAAKDIEVSHIKVSPRYETLFVDGQETRGRRLGGYTASNTMTLTIRDIPRAGILIGDLLKEGANVVEDIQFALTEDRMAAARAEVRALALRTAHHHAEVAALAARVRLGKLISLGDPPPLGSADLAGPPEEPADLGPALVIEPGVIEIHDVVRTVWALEN